MEYFIYRVNFFIWRFRSIVSFLTLIFFWQAVYGVKNNVFGYSEAQMLTYIVGIAVLRAVILGGRVADLAGLIKDGGMVNKFLLRPWNVIKVWFVRDLASKVLNLFLVVIEVYLIINLLNLSFYTPQNLSYLGLFIISCLLSLPLYFLLDFMLSIIAFWVDNVWAPRWLFGVIFLQFLSGRFFPLDVLPNFVYNLIQLTPFPYLIYFPLKIYLQQVSLFQAGKIIGLLVFWLVVIYFATKKLWKIGLRQYTAYGG
jgi:ABC-2 type transport system permease protein